ncbi:MAG: hypothetical protein Q8R76_01450 [Candidatus Omnitrophota bacterium]|nr:hypothetical protein [Candidatus Omnitrophota bacterium]
MKSLKGKMEKQMMKGFAIVLVILFSFTTVTPVALAGNEATMNDDHSKMRDKPVEGGYDWVDSSNRASTEALYDMHFSSLAGNTLSSVTTRSAKSVTDISKRLQENVVSYAYAKSEMASLPGLDADIAKVVARAAESKEAEDKIVVQKALDLGPQVEEPKQEKYSSPGLLEREESRPLTQERYRPMTFSQDGSLADSSQTVNPGRLHIHNFTEVVSTEMQIETSRKGAVEALRTMQVAATTKGTSKAESDARQNNFARAKRRLVNEFQFSSDRERNRDGSAFTPMSLMTMNPLLAVAMAFINQTGHTSAAASTS